MKTVLKVTNVEKYYGTKGSLTKALNDISFEVLEGEFDKYKEMHQRIEKKYTEFSKEDPTETSAMNKIMTAMMTEMKLMTDNSDSKIAELLMQGTNMGIIEGKKLLNHKEHLEKDVENILKEYIEMQENSVEIYKQYL